MVRGSKSKHTAQTKQDAVGQVIKAGLPLAQVLRSFDIPMQTLENLVGMAHRSESIKFVVSVSD
jgi:transposase-like protein